MMKSLYDPPKKMKNENKKKERITESHEYKWILLKNVDDGKSHSTYVVFLLKLFSGLVWVKLYRVSARRIWINMKLKYTPDGP